MLDVPGGTPGLVIEKTSGTCSVSLLPLSLSYFTSPNDILPLSCPLPRFYQPLIFHHYFVDLSTPHALSSTA